MDTYEDQKDESSSIEEKSLENMGFCGESGQKKEIGLAGFEPTTSCTPSTPNSDQTPIKPEESTPSPSNVPPNVPPTENAPLDLARLLSELAKLPPEQRQAIATLLGASLPNTQHPTQQTPTTPRPTLLDDRCALDE